MNMTGATLYLVVGTMTTMMTKMTTKMILMMNLILGKRRPLKLELQTTEIL